MKSITYLLKSGWVLLGLALFSYSTLIAQATTNPSASPDGSPEKSIFHQVEMAVISGNKEMSEGSTLSLGLINGYRFSRHFSAGIGLGWDNYDQMDMMPLFARIQAKLKPAGHTPYLFAGGGYAWGWLNETPEFVQDTRVKGGLMIQQGIGYLFAGDGWSVTIHAGLRIQKSSIEYTYPDGWGTDSKLLEERTRKRFAAGLSVIF